MLGWFFKTLLGLGLVERRQCLGNRWSIHGRIVPSQRSCEMHPNCPLMCARVYHFIFFLHLWFHLLIYTSETILYFYPNSYLLIFFNDFNSHLALKIRLTLVCSNRDSFSFYIACIFPEWICYSTFLDDLIRRIQRNISCHCLL